MIKKILIGMVCVFLVVVMALWVFTLEQITENTPIAEYEGHVFYYRDIRYVPGVSGSHSNSIDSAEKMLAIEKRRLRRIIRTHIVALAMETYEVTVEESDVVKAVDKLIKEAYGEELEAMLEEPRAEFKKWLELMEVWVVDHKKGEALYLEQYTSDLTEEEWGRFKEGLTTDFPIEWHREQLEKISVDSVKDQFREGAIERLKLDVLNNKLMLAGEILLNQRVDNWIFEKQANVKFLVAKYNYLPK